MHVHVCACMGVCAHGCGIPGRAMDAEVTGLRHGPVCDVLRTGAAITSGAQGASGGVYEASLENQAAARSCAGPQRPRGVGVLP